jgi:hypothetical protein
MHSLASVGCRLAEVGQTGTFERFLLALGPAYIRTAVARSSAVQQRPLAALLHICTFLIRQYLILRPDFTFHLCICIVILFAHHHCCSRYRNEASLLHAKSSLSFLCPVCSVHRPSSVILTFAISLGICHRVSCQTHLVSRTASEVD